MPDTTPPKALNFPPKSPCIYEINLLIKKIHAPNSSDIEIQILSLHKALHETDVWFLHLLLRLRFTDLAATQPQI